MANFRALTAPGLEAVKHNWKPFITLQAAAFAAVAAYYTLPAFSGVLDQLGVIKTQGGLFFSALTTAFAGMVLPETTKRLTMRVKSQTSDLIFQFFFFSLIGIMVDLFYQLMAVVFGGGTDAATIFKKVLVDQSLFTPFGTAILSVVGFTFRDSRFRLADTIAMLKQGEWSRRYPNVVITGWSFWIPVLVAVYALPSKLQFVLFLCAQAAWSILLIHLSRKQES